MMSDDDLIPGISLDTVYSHPATDESLADSWWSRYFSTLDQFTQTARTVLETDCRYIVDRGIFGAGDPANEPWPKSRVRRGLVMGSVQSGKTASMLGVVAGSLDRGIDVVIVLAGTRLSLWQQTVERFEAHLDQGAESSAKQRRRLLLPKTAPAVAAPLDDRYQLTPVRVERALNKRQPIIIVALKHSGHLQALGQSLGRAFLPEVAKLDRAVQMLVIDDEADDGSILDANVEASMDPLDGNLKQIPRAIVDLWSPPGHPGPGNLFATYLAYTATPQANFLQEEQNPLAPRDFLVALRTPFDFGELAPRTSTFREPKGIAHFYTGGETYYRRGRSAPLVVPVTGVAEDDLGEAMRAFIVAGGIRLYRDKERLGPLSARIRAFPTLADAKAHTPKPHSMLIHPSALVADQFTVAEDVIVWAGAASRIEAKAILASGGSLPSALGARLATEQSLWSVWLDRYLASARAIHDEFSTVSLAKFPDWQSIEDLIISEVIPGTRVAVVNSDPAADDRPEYEPKENVDGAWVAPRDMSTVFVSGNVMARGLTLEGLTTTLFLRTSDTPRADTQMQMQRWLGYRGPYVELCRVFAPREQLDFFADYHDVDEALRILVAEAMNDGNAAPSPIVLQGKGFLATGKIANLGTKPLHPGRKPFIPLINPSQRPDPNASTVATLFANADSADVTVGGISRGRILLEPLSILGAADLLDKLTYDKYAPGVDTQLGELWAQVEARISAIQPLPDGFRLYRAPAPRRGEASTPPRHDCPYGIPAYLRMWHASSSRHVRGLFVTGARHQLWSMTDLMAKAAQLPKFWVGIRYGASRAQNVGAPFDQLAFPIRATAKATENGLVKGTWGTNDPTADETGFRGDEYFDFYHRGEPIPQTIAGEEHWRESGTDGQILFYVNQHSEDAHPTIAVGICLPAGGPDQFASFVQAAGSRPIQNLG